MIRPAIVRIAVATLALASAVLTQDAPQAPPVPSVPSAPNASCPIMGKKVSLPLFVDTELGRIYVCCKPCFKKVLADVPKAHQTAYPVVDDVKNTVCPVSGEPIGKDAAAVVLQQRRFQVCCEGCVAGAQKDAQVVLAKLAEPKLVDVGNTTCPLSGAPIAANAFVVIDGHVVRLAEQKLVEQTKQDPRAVLAKAQELAKAQPPKPKHVHQPKSEAKSAASKAATTPTEAPKPEAPK